MKQREIGIDGTTWTCVQALAGIDGQAAERARQLSVRQEEVQVVCTPSGGAQSLRLSLPADWMETLGDGELADAIRASEPGAGIS